MRLGLLSDVHGNLAALNAVRSALADAGPLDDVIVAVDLLLGGPRPREVWDLLTADGCVLVQGNTDAELAGPMEPVLGPRGLDDLLAVLTTPFPKLPLPTGAQALRRSPLAIGTRVSFGPPHTRC